MKILIAPDKFKDSLSAMEVCNAIESGIKRFDEAIETIKHPLADGGEGTLTILQNYFKLEIVTVTVKDPLFKDISVCYMVSKDTAYIEMANASGLQLLDKKEKNCFNTTTYGTGQLILDAVNKNLKKIILFIGGSATNDAGIGMATALGYQFLDENNLEINPIGKELLLIKTINSDNLAFDINKLNVTVVCDVKNPLFGANGAAYVYGPQKGASEREIEILDLGLQNFSNQVTKFLYKEVAYISGAGAAGGLGGGAIAFLNAKIQSGIDFVMEQTGFDTLINSNVDLIITGEGSVDKQTLEGKVIKGISERAHLLNIPFSIIAGVIKDKDLLIENLNPKNIHSIMELGVPVEDAIQNAASYLNTIAFKLIKEQKT
jgi:glycerate kinase